MNRFKKPGFLKAFERPNEKDTSNLLSNSEVDLFPDQDDHELKLPSFQRSVAGTEKHHDKSQGLRIQSPPEDPTKSGFQENVPSSDFTLGNPTDWDDYGKLNDKDVADYTDRSPARRGREGLKNILRKCSSERFDFSKSFEDEEKGYSTSLTSSTCHGQRRKISPLKIGVSVIDENTLVEVSDETAETYKNDEDDSSSEGTEEIKVKTTYDSSDSEDKDDDNRSLSSQSTCSKLTRATETREQIEKSSNLKLSAFGQIPDMIHPKGIEASITEKKNQKKKTKGLTRLLINRLKKDDEKDTKANNINDELEATMVRISCGDETDTFAQFCLGIRGDSLLEENITHDEAGQSTQSAISPSVDVDEFNEPEQKEAGETENFDDDPLQNKEITDELQPPIQKQKDSNVKKLTRSSSPPKNAVSHTRKKLESSSAKDDRLNAEDAISKKSRKQGQISSENVKVDQSNIQEPNVLSTRTKSVSQDDVMECETRQSRKHEVDNIESNYNFATDESGILTRRKKISQRRGSYCNDSTKPNARVTPIKSPRRASAATGDSSDKVLTKSPSSNKNESTFVLKGVKGSIPERRRNRTNRTRTTVVEEYSWQRSPSKSLESESHDNDQLPVVESSGTSSESREVSPQWNERIPEHDLKYSEQSQNLNKTAIKKSTKLTSQKPRRRVVNDAGDENVQPISENKDPLASKTTRPSSRTETAVSPVKMERSESSSLVEHFLRTGISTRQLHVEDATIAKSKVNHHDTLIPGADSIDALNLEVKLSEPKVPAPKPDKSSILSPFRTNGRASLLGKEKSFKILGKSRPTLKKAESDKTMSTGDSCAGLMERGLFKNSRIIANAELLLSKKDAKSLRNIYKSYISGQPSADAVYHNNTYRENTGESITPIVFEGEDNLGSDKGKQVAEKATLKERPVISTRTKSDRNLIPSPRTSGRKEIKLADDAKERRPIEKNFTEGRMKPETTLNTTIDAMAEKSDTDNRVERRQRMNSSRSLNKYMTHGVEESFDAVGGESSKKKDENINLLMSPRTRRSRLISDLPSSPAVLSLGIGQSEHSSRSPKSSKNTSLRTSARLSERPLSPPRVRKRYPIDAFQIDLGLNDMNVSMQNNLCGKAMDFSNNGNLPSSSPLEHSPHKIRVSLDNFLTVSTSSQNDKQHPRFHNSELGLNLIDKDDPAESNVVIQEIYSSGDESVHKQQKPIRPKTRKLTNSISHNKYQHESSESSQLDSNSSVVRSDSALASLDIANSSNKKNSWIGATPNQIEHTSKINEKSAKEQEVGIHKTKTECQKETAQKEYDNNSPMETAVILKAAEELLASASVHSFILSADAMKQLRKPDSAIDQKAKSSEVRSNKSSSGSHPADASLKPKEVNSRKMEKQRSKKILINDKNLDHEPVVATKSKNSRLPSCDKITQSVENSYGVVIARHSLPRRDESRLDEDSKNDRSLRGNNAGKNTIRPDLGEHGSSSFTTNTEKKQIQVELVNSKRRVSELEQIIIEVKSKIVELREKLADVANEVLGFTQTNKKIC